MKILIISLMEGDPWGGSEELWYRVANHALDCGDEVHLSIKKWDTVPKKVQGLIKRGSIVHLRAHEKKNIATRVLNKIYKPVRKGNWTYLNNHFNHVVISFGGAYDLLYHKELLKRLKEENLNFSIIQQFNFDNHFLSDSNRHLAKSFFESADFNFFVSHRNLETTKRNVVSAIENAYVVSNPANISNLSSKIQYPNLEKPKFACVARLDVNYKNQDLIIEAFSRPEWRDRNFALNLYGKGKGENYLRELISHFGLQDKVHIQGHVDNIQDVWRNNHIMVLPSSAEGSPLSIIEAMYSGRPIIATDVAGNTELFNEKCGYVIPSIHVSCVNVILNKAWEDRGNWERKGLHAREHIRKTHNPNSHLDIYNKVKSLFFQ
jgi:glycosyltransferase involved in cell wall biosynthesis